MVKCESREGGAAHTRFTPQVEDGLPTFDLHGYTVETASMVANNAVREAWEHGAPGVRLVHGAAASRHHWDATASMGYGGIKWTLRSMLRNLEFAEYARGPGSKKHRREAKWLDVALLPNPDARPEASWTRPPEVEYEPGSGSHPFR